MRGLASWIWKAALVVVLAPLVMGLVYTVVNPASTLMLARWVTGERVERSWVPLDAIAPVLVRSVLASEDARFCQHNGIDLVELQNVMDTAEDGEPARGASTITMQLAKNLFLWNGRSFIRKGLEMSLALYLNVIMSKRRQIEIYLNIAEWGPNGEFGAEAAAQRAFNLPAARLSSRQAALLAVMLPNPHRRDAAKPGPGLSRLASRLQARLPREGAELTQCLGL
ncbi:monofunctional biosynthetic peptidoglycan transglycosylase [Ancylobacter sp. Lp-2]|uniref:monofunctional biosynthetic peptidoglycan transglycosylase n=1 Tax=Ancylobacter sp. Lp-2 TaxID=2881339 RepID=UPI001E2F13E0|nr:monofunctional biosynthetic peptidoglycan transglycosylase [Ancylobacter sp. Lp-2]MCB4770799.1 monofunctional biosynthetic peptidoglycan transglycosylase [Ancylobacter sp. Lp-2]